MYMNQQFLQTSYSIKYKMCDKYDLELTQEIFLLANVSTTSLGN